MTGILKVDQIQSLVPYYYLPTKNNGAYEGVINFINTDPVDPIDPVDPKIAIFFFIY